MKEKKTWEIFFFENPKICLRVCVVRIAGWIGYLRQQQQILHIEIVVDHHDGQHTIDHRFLSRKKQKDDWEFSFIINNTTATTVRTEKKSYFRYIHHSTNTQTHANRIDMQIRIKKSCWFCRNPGYLFLAITTISSIMSSKNIEN